MNNHGPASKKEIKSVENRKLMSSMFKSDVFLLENNFSVIVKSFVAIKQLHSAS